MMQLPELSELLNLLDLAREGGYEGDLDTFKYLLLNDPARIPFPDKKVFANGGLVTLGYMLWAEVTFQAIEVPRH